MTYKEKWSKLSTFISKFKEKIDNGEQSKMCRKFKAMLVEKLKPSIDCEYDFFRPATKAYTEFLVELGYDKALGRFWEESAALMDYYATWFDEVWYSYNEKKYELRHTKLMNTTANVKHIVRKDLGLQ